ncbi:PilZ domain-containing protein [Desulfovibrio sp. Fe33]|uniref:PilZ domain-containing protein n=1 Tax=Desulfovibrio sp. Fe33 TaxID=3020842 RepID=UPI00234CA377|nr:PilZ domain-containing protein [Desulfovibrio sp. Fe33]
MDIGIGDSILLEVSTFEDRFIALVSGVGRDGRLVVRAEVPSGVLDRIEADAFAEVLYAYDGRLLCFGTRILRVGGSHDARLELAAPKTFFAPEGRGEPRYACFFPASVSVGERVVNGVVDDISDSCARIRFPVAGQDDFPIETGGGVRLTIRPYGVKRSAVSVGCSVLKVFMKDHERYAVLRFENDEPDIRARISGFIKARVCCRIPGD